MKRVERFNRVFKSLREITETIEFDTAGKMRRIIGICRVWMHEIGIFKKLTNKSQQFTLD